jgi:putative transposase
MKIVIDRKFTGTLKSATISRNPSGQYFVSVLVEEDIELKQNAGRSIGIDLGLTHLAILSNGIKFENPRWFRENQAKLKKAQQHLSRKTPGSKRRTRQRLKVARIHQKITNQRNWFHHNLSSWLVDNFDVICTEDLSVKNMVRNHKLSKSISDAGWSSLISMISYKSNWYGRTFHKIDRWYASSKTCGCCGAKAEAMNLSIREWSCASCGTSHDRDINAARNILNTGLLDLYSLTSDELADYRRREEVSPEVDLPKASSMKRLVRSL